MITINGEKMSKSLGNVKTLRHVLDNWGPNIIRLFCLSGHYSKPIDYTEDLLKENLIKWRQLETCYYELRLAHVEGSSNATEIVLESKKKFDEALENDFNTPMALTEFFNMIKSINALAAEEKITKNDVDTVMPILEEMLSVLGLSITKTTDEEIKSIFDLLEQREEFRKNKQFDKADKIREQVSDKGIYLIDHKTKTLWLKKEKINAEK
jgi:cysteinyl-tRNA synthetase